MHEVAVGGDEFRLVLRVEGYEVPAIESGSDANWLTGEAVMTMDARSSFRAKRSISIRTDELASFRDQVKKLVDELTGAATLSHLEDEVGCSIRLEGGRGELTAFIRTHLPSIELRAMHVPTDQSYLQETARQLDALTAAFPVRPNPFD